MSDFNIQNLSNEQKRIYYAGLSVSMGTFWSQSSGMELSYGYDLNGILKLTLRMFSTQGGGGNLITNLSMSNTLDLKHAIDMCIKGEQFPNQGFMNIVFAKGQNGENKTVSVSYMTDNKDASKKVMFFSGKEGQNSYKVPLKENEFRILLLQLTDLIKGLPWLHNMEHFKEMAISRINPNASQFGQKLFLAAQSYQSNYNNAPQQQPQNRVPQQQPQQIQNNNIAQNDIDDII